jgi:hypothetical protein
MLRVRSGVCPQSGACKLRARLTPARPPAGGAKAQELSGDEAAGEQPAAQGTGKGSSPGQPQAQPGTADDGRASSSSDGAADESDGAAALDDVAMQALAKLTAAR